MAAEPTSPTQPPQLPTAGSLAGILDVLETDDDFRALIAGEIEEPESDIDPSITVGVPDGLRPALAAGAAGKQPVVLVVASSREAEEAVESIRSWYDGDPNDVAQLEAWETLPHERLSPRADTVASRMAVFRRLKHPEEGSTLFGPIRILVMPVRSSSNRWSQAWGTSNHSCSPKARNCLLTKHPANWWKTRTRASTW